NHLVATKPVVLDVQIGDGALARQRQHRIDGGRKVAGSVPGSVGQEFAHCIGRLTRSVRFANREVGGPRRRAGQGGRTCRPATMPSAMTDGGGTGSCACVTRYGVRADRTKLPKSNMPCSQSSA